MQLEILVSGATGAFGGTGSGRACAGGAVRGGVLETGVFGTALVLSWELNGKYRGALATLVCLV